MKLNPDCVRDVLIFLEENLVIDLVKKDFIPIELSQIQTHFKDKYTKEDVWYSVYNLYRIGYIEGNFSNAGRMKMFFCPIENITWNGHQFLNTIRPQSVWDATKQGASKLGLMSIHALSTIAMKIAENIVTNPTVINKIIEHM